ncbi:MAG: tRNA dimethylallyltransferase [Paracoccaceae bacterium]
MNQKPVIVIGGPTASGKSATALALAGQFGGEIVNADSMQIYEDLPIITARPDSADCESAPHHLYGVLGIGDRCSAGQWRGRALDAIRDIQGRGGVPIVIGGTGLYLKALMTGLHDLPAVPAEVRDGLNQRLEEEGPQVLHAELLSADPATADGLNPADGQRIVRALEIYMHTGRGLRSWQAEEMEAAPADLQFCPLALLPPREDLYAIANDRFDAMLDRGAVEEVASLLDRSPAEDFPLLKAVGVPPIRAHLAGEIDRERLKELGKRDTRRYAKRQMTWFRRQFIPQMTIETKHSEINQDEIFSEIRKFLLTD